MDYSVEDISPVEKKIVISTEPQEVDAAIQGAVVIYKSSAQMDGFRKGKIPAHVVERRFHGKIYEEAKQNLINVHINDIFQKLDLTPVSGIKISGEDTQIEKGKPFSYSLEFEVMPAFDLPPYEGLQVQQKKAVVNGEDLDAIVQRVLRNNAVLSPVSGNAPPADGQIANLDFEAFENGKPVEQIKTSGFNLELGKSQALPDFEDLVKSIPAGQSGEGEIHFPQDFLDPDLAGKTVTMKVRVNAVNSLKLPELDDEFAKKLGHENVDALKDALKKGYLESMEQLHKSEAQEKLLQNLLKMVDFPLPPSLVKVEQRFLLADLAGRLEKQGKSLGSLGKSLDELMEEVAPKANELARDQVLLLAIAKKEDLSVDDKEVITQIYKNALRSGHDFESMRKEYEQSGLIFQLRDRMLADKAMDRIYEKANVELIDPEQAEAHGAADQEKIQAGAASEE